MLAFRLPVSEQEIVLRHPTGAEDVLLSESGTLGIRVALLLLEAVSLRGEGNPVDWASLSVTDLDAALLRLRQLVLGDWIRSSTVCPERKCRTPIDLSFRIGEFLEHQKPEGRGDIVMTDVPGWYRFREAEDRSPGEVLFRIPSCADFLAIGTHASPVDELIRHCIQPHSIDEEARIRIEEALEALAPSLYADLDGLCPECGTVVVVPFDPQTYVLKELRMLAFSIYEEVDLIAGRYHWSEREILAMPRVRRMRYVELSAEKARES